MKKRIISIQATAALLSLPLLVLAESDFSVSAWRLVAQSHFIVVGTLDIPVEDLRQAIESGDHRYVELRVAPFELVKGSIERKDLKVRYFTQEAWYAPRPDSVIKMHRKNALLFLIQVDDPYSQGLYFSGHTPAALQLVSEENVDLIRKEVHRQQDLLASFSQPRDSKIEAQYDAVDILIKKSLRKETQHAAFAELEALGKVAVPAMILLMDDRRPLPIKGISLRNKSENAFEGLRHYSPELVVDAMAALLNQLTGEGFGSIYNGASERERRETVNGWRIYLHYSGMLPPNETLQPTQ